MPSKKISKDSAVVQKESAHSTTKPIVGFTLSHWKKILVILAIGGLAINWYVNRGKAEVPEYITESATLRDVVREVSVNGKVVSKQSRDLYPSVSEKVSEVLVEEGDHVNAGDVLVKFNTAALELRLGQAKAQLAQAQALLDQQIAGATGSDIALSGNDVQSAEVALAAAEKNLEELRAQKEANLKIAELKVRSSEVALKNSNIRFQNTQNNTGQSSTLKQDQLSDALEKALIVYQSALNEAKQARIVTNSIIKEDRFESEVSRYPNVIFGNKNSILKSQMAQDYRNYKLQLNQFVATQQNLAQFDWTNVDQAFDRMQALGQILVEGASLLAGTANLANDTIDSTQIEMARTAALATEQTLLAQLTKLQTALQAIEVAQLTIDSGGTENTSLIDNVRADFDSIKSQYEQAQYNKDQVMLQSDTAISQAEAEVEARRVALRRAHNGLNKVRTGPREVDLGSNRANVQIAENQVAQAQLALDEAQIVSPIEGMITRMNAKTGERPSTATPLVVVKSPDLEIVADISETDIGDVALGQTAKITFDAFSSQEIYTATVVEMAQAETVIQGVIYYEVTLELEPEQPYDQSRILSGMTADIEILIDSRDQVYAIEPQAIVYKQQAPFIRLMTGTPDEPQVEEKPVELGLEGNTYQEILSGIKPEDTIILYEDLGNRSPFER